MTEDLLEEFKSTFAYDCYTLSCELRDCSECRAFYDYFEDYRKDKLSENSKKTEI